MTVVAFDIDGVLTRDEGMQIFRRFKRRDDTTVGIVSSRPQGSINNFIERNNLDVSFAKSAFVKSIPLRSIKESFDDERYIYYGSWFRDRVASKVSGWEYRMGKKTIIEKRF